MKRDNRYAILIHVKIAYIYLYAHMVLSRFNTPVDVFLSRGSHVCVRMEQEAWWLLATTKKLFFLVRSKIN